MLAVSGKIADIDRQMQDMYRRIRAAVDQALQLALPSFRPVQRLI